MVDINFNSSINILHNYFGGTIIMEEPSRVKIMKEMIPEGMTLEIGIEKHQMTNGITLDYLEKYNPDIVCDLNKEKIPSPDNTFDVIVAGEVLEHLGNPNRVTREFHRVLKWDGVLIISVPNIYSLVNRIKILLGQTASYSAMPNNLEFGERHVVDFNKTNLIEMLEESGFTILEVKSNGLITKSKLITKYIPASLGEILIVKAVKKSLWKRM